MVEHNTLHRNAPPLTTMPISRPAEHSSSSRSIIPGTLPTAILMTVLWWALTDGHTGSWFIGIPVIVFATGASLLLQSHDLWKWRLAGLIRFFPVFLWLSLRAGFEVAIPAFHPRCPLAPGLLVYHLRLPIGPARIFFTNTISLLPGTFSADLNDDQLTVHVLNTRRPVLENLQFMESLVAQLFGIQLSTESPSQGNHHE